MRRLRRDFRREFAERRAVIENGDAATMRCDREIGCARMNLNVVHAHRRNVANPYQCVPWSNDANNPKCVPA